MVLKKNLNSTSKLLFSDLFKIRINIMIFTALNGMQTRSSDENSVCPSVCLSVRPSVKRVICDNMEEISVQIFISYERAFSLF